uniref:RNase III domain-containing protein n=1 Tax=viral metagenome TaxID=1070528 RepID=A0A6C0EQL6_9ZZZZ
MNNQILYNPYNSKNRLFTKQDIQAILQKHKCAFTIRNVDLFQTAMVHSSYVKRLEYTTPTGETTTLAPKPDNALELFDHSYETLEHLGDSILGAIVSTYLLKRFPEENEGFLTDLKKDIVCNEMLGSLSQRIGLDKFYIISRHNEDVCSGRTNAKKLGDILEAFIGALWTDSGNDFKIVSSFLIAIVEMYINIPKLLMNNRNFKEQLQKFYQAKFHHTPKYVMLSSAANTYTMAAVDEKGIHIGIGSSGTKKQAEQLAAKDAIERLT